MFNHSAFIVRDRMFLCSDKQREMYHLQYPVCRLSLITSASTILCICCLNYRHNAFTRYHVYSLTIC